MMRNEIGRMRFGYTVLRRGAASVINKADA
jgi:hypothetical protein